MNNCCPKCIIELDYKPHQCNDGECECHAPKDEAKEILDGLERHYKNVISKDYDYERVSHTHCWNNGPTPPCNIPLEKHEQCCLCDMVAPKDKKQPEVNTLEKESVNNDTSAPNEGGQGGWTHVPPKPPIPVYSFGPSVPPIRR